MSERRASARALAQPAAIAIAWSLGLIAVFAPIATWRYKRTVSDRSAASVTGGAYGRSPVTVDGGRATVSRPRPLRRSLVNLLPLDADLGSSGRPEVGRALRP
jgi:hypothetical protein